MLKLKYLNRALSFSVHKSSLFKNIYKSPIVPIFCFEQQFYTKRRLLQYRSYITCDCRGYKSTYTRNYSTIQPETTELDPNVYEHVCEETLQSLAGFFEELVELEPKFSKADVNYSSGVLTVDLADFGTYVINRQSPNKQIWLSSPQSGPKRYDYSIDKDCWVYKHDQVTLHSLLKDEFRDILGKDIDLHSCCHSKTSV